MADFHQHPKVPTLQHLHATNTGRLEEQLHDWSGEKPVALVLPALYAECERPAFPRILEAVAAVPYVGEVVVTMNQMEAAESVRALEFLRRHLHGKPAWLLWNDGPDLLEIWSEMEDFNCPSYAEGKGTNLWMALAWLEARGHRGVVVSHDTDILNYTRDLLARLSLPLLHPDMGYRFAKGYYSRVTARLHGRVTRLLCFPLIQALADVLGPLPLIEHLQAFRYPLSGEFGGDMDTLAKFALPSGWGLEIAMLAEVQRALAAEQMCQVDLGFHFEHRHRSMESGGAGHETGLLAAATEVARSLFHQVMMDAGHRGGGELLRVVLPRYETRAQEWLRRYEHLSLINGLSHDREAEREVVRAFSQALAQLVGSHPDSRQMKPQGVRPGVRAVLGAAPQLRQKLIQAAIAI